jgi:hypothetical protein
MMVTDEEYKNHDVFPETACSIVIVGPFQNALYKIIMIKGNTEDERY